MRSRAASMVLLLVIVAAGCEEDAPVPMACANDADRNLVDQPEFLDEYTMCAEAARETNDPGGETTMCLTETPGLSEACAACYGDFTVCLIDSCAELCDDDPTAPACLECADLDCVPPFVVDCSGLNRVFPGTDPP